MPAVEAPSPWRFLHETCSLSRRGPGGLGEVLEERPSSCILKGEEGFLRQSHPWKQMLTAPGSKCPEAPRADGGSWRRDTGFPGGPGRAPEGQTWGSGERRRGLGGRGSRTQKAEARAERPSRWGKVRPPKTSELAWEEMGNLEGFPHHRQTSRIYRGRWRGTQANL